MKIDKDKIIGHIENIYYNIKMGAINIIQWMPIIWGDRDWDQYYLLKMLEFKLLKMEKRFKRHGLCDSSDDHARQLKKCAAIFKRLYEDEYDENSFKKHDEKWGKIDISFKDIGNELYECLVSRKNAVSEEDKEKERHESSICHEKAAESQKSDLKEVFWVMQSSLLSWWD